MRVDFVKLLTLINLCPSSESIVGNTWELHDVEQARAKRSRSTEL